MKKQDVIIGEMGSGEKLHFSKQGRRNTLVVGSKSSEKDKYVFEPVLKQDMENKEVGIIVFDMKGDMAEKAYAFAKTNRRKIAYFNPLLKNVRYNPLKGDESTVIHRMSIMLEGYFYAITNEFFVERYKMLITYAIKVLKQTTTEDITLHDVNAFICNADGFGNRRLKQYKEKENVDIIMFEYLTEYFQNESESKDYSMGLRMLLSNILSNEKISHLFNAKDMENAKEFDLLPSLKNKEVVIIDIPFVTLGSEIGRWLANLLATTFTITVCENRDETEKHLFINELYTVLPGFYNLFSYNRSLNLSVMAGTQNLSLLTIFQRNYLEHLLLNDFQNFILMPGQNNMDISTIKEAYLFQKDVDSINFLEEGEFFVTLLDKETKGYRKNGIIKSIPLDKSQMKFYENRIKRYRKEIEQQLSVSSRG